MTNQAIAQEKRIFTWYTTKDYVHERKGRFHSTISKGRRRRLLLHIVPVASLNEQGANQKT